MKKRDQWKQKAKDLALLNRGNGINLDEIVAWSNFKKYRNQVNNRKKMRSLSSKRNVSKKILETPDVCGTL